MARKISAPVLGFINIGMLTAISSTWPGRRGTSHGSVNIPAARCLRRFSIARGIIRNDERDRHGSVAAGDGARWPGS